MDNTKKWEAVHPINSNEIEIKSGAIRVATINRDNNDKGVSNARLIASAPELLAALKESQVLLHTYQKETPSGDKFNRITSLMKNNLKAIKKAKS